MNLEIVHVCMCEWIFGSCIFLLVKGKAVARQRITHRKPEHPQSAEATVG